jgi:hypothetical protein
MLKLALTGVFEPMVRSSRTMTGEVGMGPSPKMPGAVGAWPDAHAIHPSSHLLNLGITMSRLSTHH